MAQKKNSRSRNSAPASRNKGPKGKRLRIDGVDYRMVRRADGRYNLYVEGRAGAVGSTPLVDAKDYAEARKRIKDLTKEFESMDANGFVAQNEGTVTAEDYTNNTEEVPQAPTEELDLNDLDNDGKADYKTATAGDVARARLESRGARAGDFMLRKSEEGTNKLMKYGFKVIDRNLQKIASANDPVMKLPVKAAAWASKTTGKQVSKTSQEYQTAYKREDETLRSARIAEARKANAAAIQEAKQEGYKKLNDEKAALDVRRANAVKSGNSAELAAVNAELKAWSEKKAQFDKMTPPNVKLPYPNLPRSNYSKGRTAIERRRINKSLVGMDVDERLAQRGRKSVKAIAA